MPSARILIVEDERQTVDTLRDLFEQHGYETEVALNKQVALAILQERKMDIAIISVSTQDVDGAGMLNELKKLHADLPVIVVGSQKSKRIESSSLKAGASIYIVKPFENIFILQAIHGLLEKQAARVAPKKTAKKHTKSKR